MKRARSQRTLYAVVSVLVLLALLVTACSTPAPTNTAVPPTKAPAAPTAAPTKAPAEPTKAPAAPTVAPTPKPTLAPLAAPTCTKLATAMSPKAGELGAPDKPIVMTFVPSVDTGLITRGGTALADCLTKMTGLTYKIEVGTSEAASIEAMGGGKAQIGFLNTLPILIAKAKYDIDVVLVAQRYYGVLQPDGKSYSAFDFDPDKANAGKLSAIYKPEYFAKVGSGIKTLADVKGKTFCFTSATSTSGTIVPKEDLKAVGVNPDKDIKAVLSGGHDKSAISVYQGDCDAGAAFMDVLTDSATNLKSKFPDIADKVKVFAVGGPIPNDGMQVIKGLDPKIKAITVEAILAMMKDPAGNAVVKSIYNYDGFEVADYAKYYAPYNDLLVKAGVDVSKMIRQ